MAGREKKPALLKKQNISVTPLKDGETQIELSGDKTPVNKTKTELLQTAQSPPLKPAVKSKRVTQGNKATIKKNLKIKFKPKNKNTKKIKLAKSLFKNNKHLDTKNITLVKNGVKGIRKGKPKKSQVVTTTEVKSTNDDKEPTMSASGTSVAAPEGGTPKKEPKKRAKKQVVEDESVLPLIDSKKIKVEIDDKETMEELLQDVENSVQNEIENLKKKPIKKEIEVTAKRRPGKPRKLTPKKAKAEVLKRKPIEKEENVIETLQTDFSIDPDAQNVINQLDLNVSKTIKKEVLKKRRHSIEKFPIDDRAETPIFEQPFTIFTNTHRSASPKTNKRNARIRQSMDNMKRFSPYSTRSDSSARLLRNGKHRKLKNSQKGLLEGLENEYKRRRKTSEISTSEIPKFPDYLSESDSNFSMNSFVENGTPELADPNSKDEVIMTKSDIVRKEILDSIITQPAAPDVNELQNLNIKSISNKFTAILKRSLSTETSQLNYDTIDDVKPRSEELGGFIDTNSNDVKPQIKELPSTTTSSPSDNENKTDITCDLAKVKKEDEVIEKIASSPSYKVPEKSFILDQMKQTFNDSNEPESEKDCEKKNGNKTVKKCSKSLMLVENTPETVSVAKFYGNDPPGDTSKAETPEMEPLILEPEKIMNNFEEDEDDVKDTNSDENLESEFQTINKSIELIIENKDDDKLTEEECEADIVAIPEKLPESKLPEQIERMDVEEEDLAQGKTIEEENVVLDNILIEKDISEQAQMFEIENLSQSSKTFEEDDAIESKIVEKDMSVPGKSYEKENSFRLGEDILKRFRGNSAISICLKETSVNGDVKKTELNKVPMIQKEDTEETETSENVNTSFDMKEMESDFEKEENALKLEVKREQIGSNNEEDVEMKDEMEEVKESVESKESFSEDNKDVQKVKRSSIDTTTTEKSEESIEEKDEGQEPNENAIQETPENLAIKENILNALGLQSWKAAEEAKQREKQKPNKTDSYTGTLKTVIKLNRNSDKKKGRNPLKMTLQKSKSRSSKDGDCDNSKSDGASGKNDGENACYKVMKESSSSSGWRHGSNSSDTAGANRKSHYSNRSNMDGSSEQTSDNDTPAAEEGNSDAKALVIPEKASSFSIHPGRLCSDKCAYCFWKFGLLDTPLHIAQIKSVERQDKILENEVYLMRDSCLCDACYRHVDRRSAGLQYSTKSIKRPSIPPEQNNCHVIDCDREGTNVLRRKWVMKMRKSINRILKIDLDNAGLHSVPVCAEHYRAVEPLMICALCKRRLARNHIHYLGNECDMLNTALQKEGIPVTLTDKPIVCKLCRYFSQLLTKTPGQGQNTEFLKQYRKKLLQTHAVEVMDDEETEESVKEPVKDTVEKEENKEPKKKNKNKSSKPSTSKLNTSDSGEPQSMETEKPDQMRVPLSSENGESRASTPSDTLIDYDALVPNLSLECSSDVDETKNEVPQKTLLRKIQRPESVREAVEISKIMKVKKSNLVERLGSNPSISVRQLFQGEEDLPLQANIDFSNIKERTPEGWEKCVCTIQYDTDTKHLWQELQRPYGNQSSFLRHLILLEKYFRNGDLTLSPNASHHAVNYSVSVQNRLRAYDNIPSNSVPVQPLTMLPFNQNKKPQSGITPNKEPQLPSIINAANIPKNTPITLSHLPPNILNQISVRQKPSNIPPPGLISLQPGTNRPISKATQKIKVPISKNWKPTLIPVTSTMNATDRRLSGLVQVISGGKPYHISLQDYNKMCQLKRNQELRKMAEANKNKAEQGGPSSSLLKPVVPRKQKAVSITPTKTQTSPSSTKESTSTKSTPVQEVKEINTQKDNNTPKPVALSKSVMILPKIPKSLTVIPQTVPRKPLQPPSPTLSITSKPSTSKS